MWVLDITTDPTRTVRQQFPLHQILIVWHSLYLINARFELFGHKDDILDLEFEDIEPKQIP